MVTCNLWVPRRCSRRPAISAGNVIGDYKFAVDYAAGMTYWQRQRQDNPCDLEGVALTLARDGAGYAVTAVADRYGNAWSKASSLVIDCSRWTTYPCGARRRITL